jgi:MFS family permease
VAFVAPIAISMSVRLQQLAPGHEEYLGYLSGIGAAAAMVSAPFVGILSDRTRSRFGRRRPYLLAGAALGTIALVVMAAAPSVLLLGLGWVLAQIGWGGVLTVLLITQADRLPEEQRGKVAGLTGFTQMLGPIIGAGIASALVANAYLMLLVPGVLGVVAVVSFVVFVDEADSRDLRLDERPGLRAVFGKYLYSPRRYPDFSWNWLGRVLFNSGVSFSTTFTAVFYADRLDVQVKDIAGLVAILSVGGVLAAAAGALGGGFLSDRLHRRRVFVLASGAIFTAGSLLLAFGPSMPFLIAGSIVTSLGLGAFSAVDQALVLDVLPERDTDAGRFLGIHGFSTSIPQAVAPLLAPAILVLGVAGSDKNYTLLFVLAGALTLAGGTIVVRKVRKS